MIRYHYPPICKTCFSTSEWIWHTKKYLVNLQKFWDWGRPPPPHVGKNSQIMSFFFWQRTLEQTIPAPSINNQYEHIQKLWKILIILKYSWSNPDNSCNVDKWNIFNCMMVDNSGILILNFFNNFNQSINQSYISGLFHSILLPDHSWQIIEISQGQT